MSRYYTGWAPYVPVAERRRRAERELMKLARKGQTISPVKITGRKIASTFWGKSWCENLERYRDFENRLPRGRSYVRNGTVLDLQISQCEVCAMVSGSSLYHVSVTVGVLPKAHWQSICRDCAGSIDSLVELLQGRLSKPVMERVCQPGRGLFPQPSEIKFTCSCPDYAFMCKHIAAVLYGVGARLDEQPELLFTLRAVDQAELISDVDSGLFSKTEPDAATVLADDDLSALFGLDMAEDTPPSNAWVPKKPAQSKSVTTERTKSSTAGASKRVVPAPPKGRGTTKTAVRALPKSLEKTPVPRTAPAQLASKANKRELLAAPGRAVARPTACSIAETTLHPKTRTKRGRPTAASRARRS